MLTELEKRLVLELAERGPLSGYDFHLGGKRKRGTRKALMSSGYWLKVKKKLGSKGKNLILPVQLKRTVSMDERGRRKDLFWLTNSGIVTAIENGANLKLLSENVKKVYPRDEEKALLVELSNIVDRKFIAQAYQLSQSNEVDVNLIIGLSILGSSHGLGSKESVMHFRKLNLVLRKYPKFHRQTKRIMSRWVKTLKEFQRISKGVKP